MRSVIFVGPESNDLFSINNSKNTFAFLLIGEKNYNENTLTWNLLGSN